MPLKQNAAETQARELYDIHLSERRKLDVVRRYWKGRQRHPVVLEAGTPREVRVMAASSRVNVLPLVVNSLVQSSFVDGFRGKDSNDDIEVWKCWQANRMDARQTAIHRAASGYGASYAVVLPGEPVPVIRRVSPRAMTALYGEDEDWPMWGLERVHKKLWCLYDEEAIYYLTCDEHVSKFELIETREHGGEVAPIVRYIDEDDLDDEDEVLSEALPSPEARDTVSRGQVAPLMSLQDQTDLTTFSLQVAQHYGAFKQRWIIGWAAESEKQAVTTAASRFLTLPDHPDDVKVGEFGQTDLSGYINSREATLRHIATISQTPVHELLGQLVNLSAEALAAAEAGKDRKVDERKALWGESHEQALWLAGKYMGVDVPDDAQVVWRDTSARAFAATVDGLGKLAQMLGVPPEELWERIPGVTQQDVKRWKSTAQNGDAFSLLSGMLDRQATPEQPPATQLSFQ